jgi:BlaI family penicillinase repressor
VRPVRRRPTDGELAILRVLWDRGPSTVREVAEATGRTPAYTTVLKLLQIMTEKGLVRRDESSRTHVYAAAHSRVATQRHLLRDLVDRAFDGSAVQLMAQALAATNASPEELAEIRALLARHRKADP